MGYLDVIYIVEYRYNGPASCILISCIFLWRGIKQPAYKNYIGKRFLNDVKRLRERLGDTVEIWQRTITR